MKRSYKREETNIIKKLNKLLPECGATPISKFYDDNERIGIWFRGSEETASDGISIFYETDNYEDKVHPIIEEVLSQYKGWYSEPYDSGTLMAGF
tara:strand:+ start:1205 stop:1489 length:285 start_codon:yes stop_codon:yes gene_type:complete